MIRVNQMIRWSGLQISKLMKLRKTVLLLISTNSPISKISSSYILTPDCEKVVVFFLDHWLISDTSQSEISKFLLFLKIQLRLLFQSFILGITVFQIMLRSRGDGEFCWGSFYRGVGIMTRCDFDHFEPFPKLKTTLCRSNDCR